MGKGPWEGSDCVDGSKPSCCAPQEGLPEHPAAALWLRAHPGHVPLGTHLRWPAQGGGDERQRAGQRTAVSPGIALLSQPTDQGALWIVVIPQSPGLRVERLAYSESPIEPNMSEGKAGRG